MKKERIEIVIGKSFEDFKHSMDDRFDHPEKHWGKGNVTTIYIDSAEQLPEILSPEKLRLLTTLELGECCPVNKLSKRLERKRQAVGRDLRQLAKQGLVRTEKKGRETLVSAVAKEIVIKLM